MPRSQNTTCEICTSIQAKYTCAKCRIHYCSVTCFKRHKESSCADEVTDISTNSPLKLSAPDVANTASHENPSSSASEDPSVDLNPSPTPPPLKPLTSLKWPYIPEESAYPDPLKRDDPKQLQLHQYEAIATSPAIRRVLEDNPQIKDILRSLDQLRGREREDALEGALAVSRSDHDAFHAGRSTNSIYGPNEGERKTEDVQALRQLAEAVEIAVRGSQYHGLGLDWGD